MRCFKIVKDTEADSYRLCRPGFVDTMKGDGTKRPRPWVEVCNDYEHGLLTAASTIKRTLLRLLLAVAATCQVELYVRNVVKAFVMSKTVLRRAVYMKAPKEINVGKTRVLRILIQ